MLLLLLLLQNLFDLILKCVDLAADGVNLGSVKDAGNDLDRLVLGSFDRSFDDLAVGLSGERNGAALAACARSAPNAMEVGLVGLGRFVVDDDFDAFDVETTRSEIGSEEEVGFAIAEGFDGCYTLEKGTWC